MTTLNIVLPFSGFYESIYSSEIDNIIEMEIDNGYISEEKYKETDIDYKPIFKAMSKLYVETYNDAVKNEYDIDLGLVFDKLVSPRFYNFETDEIHVNIESEVLEKVIRNHLDRDKFVKEISEKYESRSGFSPFQSTLDSLYLIKNNDFDPSHIEDYAKFGLEILEQLISEEEIMNSNYFENTFTVITENLPSEIYEDL